MKETRVSKKSVASPFTRKKVQAQVHPRPSSARKIFVVEGQGWYEPRTGEDHALSRVAARVCERLESLFRKSWGTTSRSCDLVVRILFRSFWLHHTACAGFCALSLLRPTVITDRHNSPQLTIDRKRSL